MIKLVWLLVGCIAVQWCYGQSITKQVYHYDAAGELTQDTVNSFYFTVVDQTKRKGTPQYSYYTKTRSVQREQIEIGEYLTMDRVYHPNGALRAAGRFKFGRPVDTLFTFYKNTGREAIMIFEETDLRSVKPTQILFYSDSVGRTLIEAGEGECGCLKLYYLDEFGPSSGQVKDGYKEGSWTGENPDIGRYREQYRKGILVEGELVTASASYRYDKLQELAEPVGGLITFYKHVQQVMTYPKSARRAGVQGKVFVQFLVLEDGSVSDISIAKGLDPECDREALNAVRTAPRFNPARDRGRPVKQRLVLPITFRLG